MREDSSIKMLKAAAQKKTEEAVPEPQRAFKFTYDAHRETWKRDECVVVLAKKPFQEGGMRYCYKMYEISQDGAYAPCVAKVFKEHVAEDTDEEELHRAYFEEAMTQTVADNFAQQFNNRIPSSHSQLQCRFLPVGVVHLADQGHRLLNAEPYLSGEYVKHNDNNGHVETDIELPQAFSHFTWEVSHGALLVCDIQGVGNFYTDPQIHSHDGDSFGMGNIGQDGIDKFFSSHKCNSLCKLLQLREPQFDDEGHVVFDGKPQCTGSPRSRSTETESAGPRWTARKYDGAMQTALTKLKASITQKKGKSPVLEQMTIQQLHALQSKLMALVQQHGSLNQMLLSPKRKIPGKGDPPARPESRLDISGHASPMRSPSAESGSFSPALSPRSNSPEMRMGRMGAKGDVKRGNNSPRQPGEAWAQGTSKGMKFELEEASKRKLQSSFETEPSPCGPSPPDVDEHMVLRPKAEGNKSASPKDKGTPSREQPCVCRHCGIPGNAAFVSSTGPQHCSACPRFDMNGTAPSHPQTPDRRQGTASWDPATPAQRVDGPRETARGSGHAHDEIREQQVLTLLELKKQMLLLQQQLEDQDRRIQLSPLGKQNARRRPSQNLKIELPTEPLYERP